MPIIEIKNDLEIFTAGRLIESLKDETTEEIKRVENYLNSLRKLQNAIDPPRKKRKYTKRHPLPFTPKSVPKRGAGRPEKIIVPPMGFIVDIKSTKKSISRKRGER